MENGKANFYARCEHSQRGNNAPEQAEMLIPLQKTRNEHKDLFCPPAVTRPTQRLLLLRFCTPEHPGGPRTAVTFVPESVQAQSHLRKPKNMRKSL